MDTDVPEPDQPEPCEEQPETPASPCESVAKSWDSHIDVEPDEGIHRTLSGLMELDSVGRRLAGRRLFVRHIETLQSQSESVPSRRVAHYRGRMTRNRRTGGWMFITDPLSMRNSASIDACEPTDRQQVELDTDGTTFGSLDEPICQISSSLYEEAEDEPEMPSARSNRRSPPPLRLTLAVTQDEHGRKRTKVTMPPPQRCPGLSVSKHQCGVCHRQFNTTAALRRHRTAAHAPARTHGSVVLSSSTPGRRHSCSVCGKQFNRHSNMLRHADVHKRPASDAPSPYSCDICGCQYNFVSSLTRHVVNNHMQDTELASSSSQ